MHHYQDLVSLFEHCFFKKYNTRLLLSDDEPLYSPAQPGERAFHGIYFSYGFFSSALHEISHWLLAGEERRLLEDYGYWYIPDGRNEEEQALFQQVEVKPQALEWILSAAAGYRFRFSVDNLNGELADTARFKQAVYEQVKHYCQYGLKGRAKKFRSALAAFYKTSADLHLSQFSEEKVLADHS